MFIPSVGQFVVADQATLSTALNARRSGPGKWDVFARIEARWAQLDDPSGYLRRCIVNRSHDVLRHAARAGDVPRRHRDRVHGARHPPRSRSGDRHRPDRSDGAHSAFVRAVTCLHSPNPWLGTAKDPMSLNLAAVVTATASPLSSRLPWILLAGAVLLIVLAVSFLLVDLHTAGLGVWTVGGVVGLVAGGLLLISGSSLDVSIGTIIAAVVGTLIFFISVMTAALRVRLRRPITGQEGIIGSVAEAKTDIAPEGTVVTKGMLWRARTMETGIAAGEKVQAVALSVGNPQCVLLDDLLLESRLHTLGPAIEHHPKFPDRTNVSFAKVEGPNRVRVLIWERGVGPTLASGTGACGTR